MGLERQEGGQVKQIESDRRQITEKINRLKKKIRNIVLNRTHKEIEE